MSSAGVSWVTPLVLSLKWCVLTQQAHGDAVGTVFGGGAFPDGDGHPSREQQQRHELPPAGCLVLNEHGTHRCHNWDGGPVVGNGRESLLRGTQGSDNQAPPVSSAVECRALCYRLGGVNHTSCGQVGNRKGSAV